MKSHYTKKEYEALLKNLRIVCQSNEKNNDHILNYFDRSGIGYVNRSIPEGDYSLMIKACPELGFPLDTYFFDEVFIERKNSLQELANSLYGQKIAPSFIDEVCEGIKSQKQFSGFKTASMIREIKEQFSVYDDAFLRELKRAINKPYKFLLVEQPNGWEGILKHDYPNKYSEAAFWGMLHSIEIRYGLNIKFISKENIGLEIFTICKQILNASIDR